jgi:phosphogluconate dehydratase
VTERIRRRSAPLRARYLREMEQMRGKGIVRHRLSCTNLAHGFAGAPPGDKIMMRQIDRPNIAIVSSYNDMLSAHQPFERFPAIIKDAAREAGATAQFAAAFPRCATASRRASRGWSCRCSAAT